MSGTRRKPMPSGGYQRVTSTHLSDAEKAWLEEHAARCERSVSYVVRTAIQEFRKREQARRAVEGVS